MKTMGAFLTALACFLLAAPSLPARAASAPTSGGRPFNLVLPHPLRPGETAWLVVKVGVIERGAEIKIETPSGRLLGDISPFAIRSGQPAGSYTVPLPASAISHNRVALRLFLDDYLHPPRAPSASEVSSVRVRIMPAAHADQK
ncbi:MAG: hypothetical protein ACRD27_04820 [Terracidiphilus sp.]